MDKLFAPSASAACRTASSGWRCADPPYARRAQRAKITAMPYASNEDLPPSVRNHLPPHAQDIYRAAFNSAWQHDAGDEAIPHRIAWAAVKRRYRKFGDEWVPIED